MGQVIQLPIKKTDDDFFVETSGCFVGITADIMGFFGDRVGGYTVITPQEARRLAGELLAAAIEAEAAGRRGE